MQIVNKIVLITGASSGIGAAIAKAACQAGADRILLMARSERRLGKVADEIKSKGGKAIVYPVDLTNPGEVQTVTQHILDPVGAPDILINNAGIGRWRFLCEMGTEESTDTMALLYFATAWVTRAFLPAMLERDSGHIVNISSVASRLAWPGATAYIAACRAMRGLPVDLMRGQYRKEASYQTTSKRCIYNYSLPCFAYVRALSLFQSQCAGAKSEQDLGARL